MHTLILLMPTLALAIPVPELEAEKIAKDYVAKAKATSAELKVLKSESLAKVFPDLTFFTIRFRKWPVAVAPAAGFRASNILTVNGKGETTLTTGGMQLSKLFQKLRAKDEGAALEVVKAMLTLESELLQDGFFKFKLHDDSLKTTKEGDKLVASGRMDAVEGGNGSITARITFHASGEIFGTSLNHSLSQGVRPRCQATLLLHPDPRVRAVCERNLLILGRSASDYLREQRAKASPALRAEIDRVWQKIEAAGR